MHGKIHDGVECGVEAIFGPCTETGGAGESVCWDMRRKLREKEVEVGNDRIGLEGSE